MFQCDVFYDITDQSWYLDEAMEAAERGMVKGTTDITFSPDGAMTRGQVVTILARMEQADTASAPVCAFTDVDQTCYYSPAVNWAYANQIVLGITETQFAPDEPVTRQQLVTILIRYLTEVRGLTLEPAELTFTDQDQISSYALESVQKAVAIGLIQGYPDGSFQPMNPLLRSEGVAMLIRVTHYLEELDQQPQEPDHETPPEESPEASPDVSPEPSASSEPSTSPEPSASPTPSEAPDSTTEPEATPTPSASTEATPAPSTTPADNAAPEPTH